MYESGEYMLYYTQTSLLRISTRRPSLNIHATYVPFEGSQIHFWLIFCPSIEDGQVLLSTGFFFRIMQYFVENGLLGSKPCCHQQTTS